MSPSESKASQRCIKLYNAQLCGFTKTQYCRPHSVNFEHLIQALQFLFIIITTFLTIVIYIRMWVDDNREVSINLSVVYP